MWGQPTGGGAPLHIPEPLIVAVAVLLVGSIAASFVDRIGAPTLLVFLSLGMLLGEDGPGGIHFDDAALARDAGTVALMVILIEGGLLAERSEVRKALGPAGLLATAGVLVTAGIVAVAARVAVDLSWTTALLLGAAVSSTDAAAVFASLRGTGVRRRLSSILEAESGFNDPFAALLVIGLVEWSTRSHFGFGDGLLLLAEQAGIGAIGGLTVGMTGVWLLRRLPLPSAGLAPVIMVAIALAGAVGVSALNGSGLLAAYLIGLVIGDARIPHAAVVRGFLQGAAWLAQLGLFVLLGLLVTPSRMLDEGAAPILVAVALVLVARPVAVFLCTAVFGVSLREQTFLAWAGLRGGVPIVLATFPVAAGVPGGQRVFDAVFFVVVLSVAAQGLTMRWAARTLALVEQHPVPRLAALDSATLSTLHSELVELRADDLGLRTGTLVRDAELPGAAIIVAIRRGELVVRPRGSSALDGEDHLYLLVASERLRDLQDALDHADDMPDAPHSGVHAPHSG
ncbi:MAG: potassium/hydrogen antiporter [Gaiellales bacterium]|jgi:cell volume regulation protein A|nr:potassium/hydrogen antiporter [Gaiellales bacterium]